MPRETHRKTDNSTENTEGGEEKPRTNLVPRLKAAAKHPVHLGAVIIYSWIIHRFYLWELTSREMGIAIFAAMAGGLFLLQIAIIADYRLKINYHV
jgi:hypothetical protein